MLTSERKALLLKNLKNDGRLVAKDFSARLQISEDTIRRDLRELAADGLLQRVHGGALPLSPTTVPLHSRRAVSIDEKVRLAKKSALLLKSGQRIFMDGGTSNLELVRKLPIDFRATIATHSPHIAAALEFHLNVDTILIGGAVFRHSMVTVGAEALLSISRMRFDLCIIGITGLRSDTGLMTGDFEEAAIKRAIIAQSNDVMVLVTRDKLHAVSAFVIDDISRLTDVVVVKEAKLPALPKTIKVHRAV
jgi:DeoR/GlpR family transcriptional regulator of sugar metabolism